jgi:hypothetical protein
MSQLVRTTHRQKVLFICGSINQTRQMHQIAAQMGDIDAWFTPYYVTGILSLWKRLGFLEMSIGGYKLGKRCLDYLHDNKLSVDEGGKNGGYDLVVTCTDQVVPNNITAPLVLVQEGMLDPINFIFHLHKALRFVPRWMAGTAATGQSMAFQKFCVASEGYRDYFVKHGIDRDRIVVTGIPNFDNCARYLKNEFPHSGYCLVCTSDARETLKFDNRQAFIDHAKAKARGKQLIFKLHPNEDVERAKREIAEWAPGSLVYTDGSAEEMVANADIVICQYSSLAFVALALGKELHSYFDQEELARLLPIQNRDSASRIAFVCREVLAYAEAEARIRRLAAGLAPSVETLP